MPKCIWLVPRVYIPLSGYPAPQLRHLALQRRHPAAKAAGTAPRWCVCRDSRPLLRHQHYRRRLAAAEKRTLIEIQTGCKVLYVAGVHLASHLVLPWIGAAVESLRAAGFSRAAATMAVEAMSTRALRAYTRAGRKAWSFTAEESLETIRGADPQLAKLYAEGVAIALKYFR